ncbi:hypothetical protein MPSEU_000514900 [Mayamaea pseudoterrestris]|nr:hypothetical protein MPSEU_000514900 [Mayamaea pseudoterrestris]
MFDEKLETMRFAASTKLLVTQTVASMLMPTLSFPRRTWGSAISTHNCHSLLVHKRTAASSLFLAINDEDQPNSLKELYTEINGEDMLEELWSEMDHGQPSEWQILKQLLGINIFTYVLAGAIVFFLSMNVINGSGWLGSSLRFPGTGSITDMSSALPSTVDLNLPDFKLE